MKNSIIIFYLFLSFCIIGSNALHAMEQKNNSALQQRIYCQPCNTTISNKYHYKMHVLTQKHIESLFKYQNALLSLLFPCNKCDRTFDNQRALATHKGNIHTQDRVLCTVCNKTFACIDSLNQHKTIHIRTKPYQCNYCNKNFTHHSTLTNHIRTHTGEKPYNCEICDKDFAHYSTFTNHKRLHTNEKPYECSLCNVNFVQLNGYNQHKRSEQHLLAVCAFKNIMNKKYRSDSSTSDYSYHDSSDESFSDKSYNENHHEIKQNSKPKKHQCSLCNKSFESPSHAINHMRIHTGEKPYYCQTCNSRFTQEGNYRRHLETNNHLRAVYMHNKNKNKNIQSISDSDSDDDMHEDNTIYKQFSTIICSIDNTNINASEYGQLESLFIDQNNYSR